jgi:hypothetical protein
MSGRFAVIVSTRDGVSIFHDAFGARTIYYLKDNRRPVFASHAGLIGHAFGVPRSLEMDRLISTPEFAKRWVKYLPGDMTMFEGVFALVPNHSLNFPSMETYRYWPDRGVSPSTFDDFFQEIDALFMSTIDFLGDRYTPVFGITGGIDSRAVYSAWRKRGIAFRGFSWGRPRLKSAEIPIVNAIVSYLGVPHEMIDFSGKHDRAIAAIAGENIGEFRGSSPLAAEMYGFCARFPSAVFVRGHGGEIVRGFYNLESDPMENASPVEMARVYRAARPSEYASLSRAAFEDFHQRADYEGIDRYGFDINDIFYWEHRMGMWAGAMVNELDAAVLSFPGINSRAVYEAAFGLPREERLTKNLLRRVVQRYDPQLAEIAVDPR